MRRNLLKKALKLDQDVYTPSDYCIMGKNMKFDNYSPESIRKEIVDYFEQQYDIKDIVYVNAVYDIKDIYDLLNK